MLRVAAVIVPLLLAMATTAEASETYRITGKDELRIVGTSVVSLTSYNGLQSLTVTPLAKGMRSFRSDARVRITSNGSSTEEKADAEITIDKNGDERTLRNNDPAYLTVLTQPFAAALDTKTLHDITRLKARVPFTFSSGIAGSNLRGTLKFRGFAEINNAQSVGFTFNASGPVYGTMPGERGTHLMGHVTMLGRAFYRLSDAILMKLVTTVVTSGTISYSTVPQHIRVTYARLLLQVPTRSTPVPAVPTPTPTSSPSPSPSTTPMASPIPIPTAAPTPTPTPLMPASKALLQ